MTSSPGDAQGSTDPVAGPSRQGDAPARDFVLPPLPSVTPAAFQMPQQVEQSGDFLSTSSSTENALASPARNRLQELDSDSSVVDEFEALDEDPIPQPREYQGGSRNEREPVASSSSGLQASQPLLPSVWARGEKSVPEIARTYGNLVVCWCFIDGEGVLGMFAATTQLHWWHTVHRLVDLVVKQGSLCQAEGGQQGFCFVSGIDGSEPAREAANTLECAAQLLSALRQVRLPNGEPVSVRLGLHYGPATDGLIGVGKSVHYQMTGPTVWTAKQLALSAPPGGVVVSDAVKRLLRAEPSSSIGPGGFGQSVTVPLTHAREIPAHAYNTPPASAGPEVQRLLARLQQQIVDSSDPFAAASLSFAAADQASRLDHAAGSSAGYYPREDIWAEPVDDSAMAKEIERLAWEDREFVELYHAKRQRVCVTANLVMSGALLWWLIGPHAGLPDLRTHFEHIMAALALSILSSLLPFLQSWHSQLSLAVRLGRVALLINTQYSTLLESGMSYSEHVMAFTVFLTGASLLDSSPKGPGFVADCICGGLAAAVLPVVWTKCNPAAAVAFGIETTVGIMLPRLLKARPVQRPLRLHHRQPAKSAAGGLTIR